MTEIDQSQGSARQRLRIKDKSRLVAAVDSTGVLLNPAQRDFILSELRGDFGSSFDPARLGSANTDTYAIVSACLQHDAILDLVLLIGVLGGQSREWEQLDTLVKQLLPGEVSIERRQGQQIETLLSLVTLEQLNQAFADPEVGVLLPAAARGAADAIEAFRRIEETPGSNRQRTGLYFLEVLAAGLDPHQSAELRRVVDNRAAALGLATEAEQFREALHRRPAEPETQVGAPEGDGNTDGLDSSDADAGDDVNITGANVLGSRLPTLFRPPVWGGVPPRNTNFTGRDDLLASIQQSLIDDAPTTLLPQPLYGLGGIGKSQLAIEYAYRFQANYDLIWWIQADDVQSINRSFKSLAKRLELPRSEDVQDVVDAVIDVLRRGEPHRRWLLIFDNADDPAVVRPYLPPGPGDVLITSRNRAWSSERSAIEVDVFTPDESVELIRARWKELSERDALLLADRLGHLPLALEQALALHQQTGMPLDAYLRALDQSPSRILHQGADGQASSLAGTLAVAYEKLKATSLAAAQLLELCAFLGPQPIAVQMLTRGRGAPLPPPLDSVIRDETELRIAVRWLGRFALAQIDPGRDLIRVHGLVSAVLRDGLADEARLADESNAHALLGLANPGRPDEPGNWPQHAQIAPHVIPSGIIYSANKDARRVMLDQIRYLYAIGDYAASRELGTLAVETWRSSLGQDDEMTLVAQRHLANSLRALGRYSEARTLNVATLDRMRAILPGDHEHTLATAMSVAADLRLVGEFGSARTLDEENLVRYRAAMGESDLGALRQAHNLAVDYRLLGLFTKALELDQETLRRRADILGEDDPRTLFSYTSLVRDLYGLGRYADALAMQRDKLRTHETRRPPGHPELIYSKRNLAILWRKTGNYRLAREQAQANYDLCRVTFGKEHEHTLAAAVSLTNILRVSGEPAQAERYGQDALTGYRDLFGARHPFVSGAAVNVAIALRALGRKDAARSLNDDALTSLREMLGDDHPYTLCAAANKTNDLFLAGDFQEATELSRETLERSERVRGENHPYTLACAANLAFDLDAVQEGAEANRRRKDALARMSRILGQEHPETISMSLGNRVESDVELPMM